MANGRPLPAPPILPSAGQIRDARRGPIGRFAGKFNQAIGRLAGPVDPNLSPQEQEFARRQQQMAMLSALLQSSAPRPVGSGGGGLAPIGDAIQAAQAAGAGVSDQSMRRQLLGIQGMTAANRLATANNVQSTIILDNGNIGIVRRDGTVEDTGTKARGFAQRPIDVAGGKGSFDPTTGEITGTLSTPEEETEAATSLEGALIETRAETESQTQARLSLPRIQSETQTALDQVQALRDHPGRAMATGFSRIAGVQHVPGTAAHDFDVLRDQVSGGVFLEAFQALKGGGTITEIEGQKAEAAKARMDAAQSEQAFLDALDDYEAALMEGLRLASEAAGGGSESESSDLPEGVTEADVQHTMQVHGMTRAEVLEAINAAP